MFDRVVGFCDFVSHWLSVLAGVGLFILMFGTSADVIKRNLIGGGLPGVVEYAGPVLVAIVYLSMSQAQRDDLHVSVDLVVQRMRPRPAAAVEAAGLALVTILLFPVVSRVVSVARHSIAVGEYQHGVTRALIWPARIAIAVGLFMLVVQLVLRVVLLLRTALGRAVEEGPAHSDVLDSL